MTITLTPEIERALAARAERQGTTPERLALHDLHALYVGEQPPEEPRTGADLLALWEREGAFLPHESLPDSPALARRVRERSQRPRGHGRDRA